MQTFVSNLRPAEIAGALSPPHSRGPSMRANVEYSRFDADWTRVTDAAECPVCAGEDELACCVEEPSQCLDDGGWLLHGMKLAPAALLPCLARPAAAQPRTEPLSSTSSGVVS